MEDPLAPYREELRAHCYQMLGSFHDAEDVLQEVSLRAWRARAEFQGRSSLRTWLHRIAVNCCLNALERKERRVLPIELGPSADGLVPLGDRQHEVAWLEPFPAGPEQQALDSESVELAFVAAVQRLPANQRAALIMFDVLGFSAQEISDIMDTTPASVNSALQRARKLIDQHRPVLSQQASLATLADARQRDLVARYSAALREHDLNALLELLTEDATWSMPPIPSWFQGHAAISGFLQQGPFRQRWRHLPTRANGQLAVGCYLWERTTGTHLAYALDVLEVRGDRIASIVAFLDGRLFPHFGLPLQVPG